MMRKTTHIAADMRQAEVVFYSSDLSIWSDLASAIRAGATAEAEFLLDKLASEDSATGEAVERGRHLKALLPALALVA